MYMMPQTTGTVSIDILIYESYDGFSFVYLGHSMAPAHRHTSGRSLVLSLLCLQIIFLQVTSGKFKQEIPGVCLYFIYTNKNEERKIYKR